MIKNPHFVKLQQLLAYAKNEDTSVYKEEYTFGKITTYTSLGQNEDTSVYRDESTFR